MDKLIAWFVAWVRGIVGRQREQAFDLALRVQLDPHYLDRIEVQGLHSEVGSYPAEELALLELGGEVITTREAFPFDPDTYESDDVFQPMGSYRPMVNVDAARAVCSLTAATVAC